MRRFHWCMCFLLFLTQVRSSPTHDCPATKEPDTKHFDLRLPEIRVPKQHTTYVCQHYTIPTDKPYHAVAFEPIINNAEVMHHMILFGCRHKMKNDQPHVCGVEENKCLDWLTVWTLGVQGQICTYNNTGVRFGTGGIKHMYLQIHWNNAKLQDNLIDSSGMRVFYTDRLKKFGAGNVQIGQTDLEIPAGSRDLLQWGGCSESCTRHFLPQPIYVTRTYLHMHYLGVKSAMDIYKNGRLLRRVAIDNEYDYAGSPIHNHDPPVKVNPGEEIRVSCWFDSATESRRRNKTIYYGEGAMAEMCFAFVSYFPFVSNLPQCAQFAQYDLCRDISGGRYGDCDTRFFYYHVTNELLPVLQSSKCNFISHESCPSVCRDHATWIKSHSCMQGRVGAFVRRVLFSTTPGLQRVGEVYDTCVGKRS